MKSNALQHTVGLGLSYAPGSVQFGSIQDLQPPSGKSGEELPASVPQQKIGPRHELQEGNGIHFGT